MDKPTISPPCKYEHTDFDWVDYGSTKVSMPSFECLIYEDDTVSDEVKGKVSEFLDRPNHCGPDCPGYKEYKEVDKCE